MRSVQHNKCFRNSQVKIVNNRIQKKDVVKDICKEYSLKRNNFNPTDKSPNNFVKLGNSFCVQIHNMFLIFASIKVQSG